jgi:hypothetical protein
MRTYNKPFFDWRRKRSDIPADQGVEVSHAKEKKTILRDPSRDFGLVGTPISKGRGLCDTIFLIRNINFGLEK